MTFWSPRGLVQKARKPRKGGSARGRKAMDAIAGLGDEAAKKVHRELVAGINTFKQEITPGRLGKIYDGSGYQKIVDRLPWDQLPKAMKDSFSPLVGSSDAAGKVTIKALPAQKVTTLRFDTRNPRIARYITQRTGSLIVESTQETQNAVKAMVRNALNRGDTPRKIADQAKDIVGLTSKQGAAVLAYRRGLEEKGLPPAKVSELGAAYAERTLDRRGMMIGITESRFAVNLGQQEVWNAAVEQDLMPAETRKRWMVEDNPCDVCAEMQGEAGVVEVGELFELPDGQELMAPPAHPLCKCSVVLDL